MFELNQWWDNLDSADRVMFLRIVFGAWLFFSFAVILILPSGGSTVLFIAVLNPLAALILGRVAFGIIATLATATIQGLAGSGGDPYEVGYSAQDAMVIRGDWKSAVKSYHEILQHEPGNLKVRLRLARLLVRNGGSVTQVEAHYYKAREIDSAEVYEAEISNALIDLYRAHGLLDELRRELTRSAQLHAGTPRGDGATRALREMAAGGANTPPG